MEKLKNLPQVGKGVFTRCYQLDEDTVLLESYDPIKAVMADGLFPKSKLFPKVQRYENAPIQAVEADGLFPKSKLFPNVQPTKNALKKSSSFYTMRYFKGRPKRSTKKWLQGILDSDQYEIYETLENLRKEVDSSISGKRGINRQEVWNAAFMTLEDKKLGRLLVRAYNACCTVGDNIMFDFAPKNVAALNGKLILLDCFYSSKLMFKFQLAKDKPPYLLDWK